ncbi:MAG: Dabb family protein [Planctomycetota bacterium]|nr:Dabb family protein [Planctomycetota bacterium]MDG1983014.1 Dabb family protein [Planctomycetota bacterium]
MLRLLPAAFLFLTACAAPSAPTHADLQQTRVLHDVFFILEDSSPEACEALAQACLTLSEIPGVLHLTAGTRDTGQGREVNRQDFHVGLHVEFDSPAAYEAYGPHPTHQALVEAFKGNFKAVEVFDYLPTR